MPLSKIQDFRDLSDQELDTQILSLKRQLFELRLQKATRQEVKPHLFQQTRRQLAQLLTLERERQLTASSEASSDDSEVAET